MANRLTNVIGKGWSYLIKSLEEPGRIPAIVTQVGGRRAHFGEVLNASRNRVWLQKANINTIIDVGAHMGEFASGVKSILPHAQTYSFEPQPECHLALTERMQKYDKAKTFCMALGSQSGEMTFYKSEFSKSSSLLPMSDLHKEAFPWSSGGQTTKVMVSTLDDQFTDVQLVQNVLLKLDVQGFELEVLKGGPRTLEQVKFVLAETSVGGELYQGEATFNDLYDYLKQFGFHYGGNWDQMVNPQDGIMLQVDALFVRG
jgi:FkbM family methyltransferase